MTVDVLEQRLKALEQKVGTEQAMRIALLTDITARLDMLEHKAGEAPPADPAAEVPLTRDEAEEIAKTCARIAAARPQAPSDLATVNMRGWRPHAWVVDSVLDGACRSRVGQARAEGALAELRSDHERDQQAIALRIAKIAGIYRDDDDDEVDLGMLLGMLEANVMQLRQDAGRACDAQRAAMEERDLLRDQRNAMRAERDQALADLERETSDLAAANERLRADVASMSGDIAAVLTATGTRTIGEATEAIAKLKTESISDVMAKLEQLRTQIGNMHADQLWLKRCEEMEVQLGGALGISSHDVPSWHAMLVRVRELCKRASGGVGHE